MAKTEFLRLTDWKTGAPIFLDVSQILCIRQLAASEECSRRTRVDLFFNSEIYFLVSEEALEIALKSGRGFYGLNEPEVTL